MYSSIQTMAKRTVLIPCVSRLSGNLQVKNCYSLGIRNVSFVLYCHSKLTHMDGNHGKCDQPVSMEWFQLCRRLKKLVQIIASVKYVDDMIDSVILKVMKIHITLPNAERHFEILATPSIHLFVYRKPIKIS